MHSISKFLTTLLVGMFGAVSSAHSQSNVWEEKTPALSQITELPSGTLTAAELKKLTEIGGELFSAKFSALDGRGRPGATQAIIPTRTKHSATQPFARTSGPDAGSCAACHNEPLVGGAGDFVTNVFVSEGFNNADFDTSDPQFSNERGTNHLFGAGLIELLAREMSHDLATLRSSALERARAANEPVRTQLISKGVSFGRITAFPDGLVDLDEVEGVDTDLVIRPFSQKGVMASLRQFTINAMNHHHGMQADERFGARWTATNDFDADGYKNELSAPAISALVSWQASLKPPVTKTPKRENWKQAATKGAAVFNGFGCNMCHKQYLPLKSLSFQDPGPLDVSGTLNTGQVENPAIYDLALLEWAKTLPENEKGEKLIPLFGDLKRHKMTDRSISALGNELLSQRFVGRDIFMTSELWGVASTAPYGHRNDFSTLNEIILAHGGDARTSRDAYQAADDAGKSALIAYLKTLVIEK